MGTKIGTPSNRSKAAELTDLGHNIKWHMEKRQLKNEALAGRAGVGKNTLSRMCFKGGPSPTVDNIQKVADALEVPLWSLFLPPEDREEP